MSILKNTYGQYFPELNNLADNILDASVTLKIGKKDYAAKIEKGFLITIENLPKKFIDYLGSKHAPEEETEPFSFDQFIIMFDGFRFKEANKQMISNIKNGPNYTLVEIDNWAAAIFLPDNKHALDFMQQEKGLSEETLKEYKIGYNKDNKSIIVPYINFTGNGVCGIKKYVLTEEGTTYESESDPPYLLLGYHELIERTYIFGKLFLAEDELEAILLRQLGFKAIGPYDSAIHEWLNFLRAFHVLIYLENTIYHYDWNIDNIKKIPVTLSLVRTNTESIADLVTKKGVDKDGLEKLVDERLKINHSIYRSFLNIKDLQKHQNYSQADFSQAFVGDKQYYGLIGGEDYHLVSSDRTLNTYVDTAQFWASHSCALIVHEKQMANFSHEAVTKYVTKNYTPTSISAYEMVRKFVKDFIYFPDEESYTFISLWILGTYIYKNFDYYPYLHINSPKGSGKSTLMDVLSNLCFNAKYYVDPTPAVVFREIEFYQSTILFDEVEDFKNNSSKRDLFSLLNQGFSKRSSIPRVSGKETIYYNMYCPKAFAGINKINDVLLSRSIKVSLIKKPQAHILKNYSRDHLLDDRIQKVCDEIYIFGLYFAKKINGIYKSIRNLPELNDVFNREMDTWAALFSMAQLVDTDNTKTKLIDELRTYLVKDRNLKKQEEGSTENKIADFLSDYIQTNNPLKTTKEGALVYDPYILFKEAKKEGVLPKDIDSRNKLTTYLKENFEFDNPNVRINKKSGRYLAFDKDKLINKLVEYGINITEENLIE